MKWIALATMLLTAVLAGCVGEAPTPAEQAPRVPQDFGLGCSTQIALVPIAWPKADAVLPSGFRAVELGVRGSEGPSPSVGGFTAAAGMILGIACSGGDHPWSLMMTGLRVEQANGTWGMYAMDVLIEGEQMHAIFSELGVHPVQGLASANEVPMQVGSNEVHGFVHFDGTSDSQLFAQLTMAEAGPAHLTETAATALNVFFRDRPELVWQLEQEQGWQERDPLGCPKWGEITESFEHLGGSCRVRDALGDGQLRATSTARTYYAPTASTSWTTADS